MTTTRWQEQKWRLARPLKRFISLTKQNACLSLDADIFQGFNVTLLKDFAKAREVTEEKKEINRLYAIETTMTLTGAKADHRFAVKPSQMVEIAKAAAVRWEFKVRAATPENTMPGSRQWRKI